MKKIFLVVGVLLVLWVVVMVGALVFVSMQLNSESTRERIRLTVAEQTGADIRISGHSISLLGLASVEGLVVANAAPHEQSPLVSLKQLKAKVGLFSLFSGTPVVERMEVLDLDINLYQTEEGFSLPFKKAEAAAQDGSAAEGAAAKPQLSVRVKSIDVSGVNLQVFDPEQAVLASVKDLSAKGKARLDAGEPSAELEARIASLQVTPGLRATQISTPVTLEGGNATFSKIAADFCGGKAEGSAEAGLMLPDRPFTAKMTVTEARMEEILRDIGGNPETLTGALRLDFKGSGTLNAPKDLTGKGTLRIASPVVGKLRHPMIPARLLGVPALQSGKFEAIEGTYHIEGQKIFVDQLNVLSSGLRVGLTGVVGFDKTLDLQGRLIVDANPVTKVADVAQSFMQGLLGGKKDPDAKPVPSSSEVLKGGVPFTVRGTSENPVVRPVGPDPLNLVSLISRALGFKVESEATASSPAAEGAFVGELPAQAPAADAPAAEEKPPKGGLRGLLPF